MPYKPLIQFREFIFRGSKLAEFDERTRDTQSSRWFVILHLLHQNRTRGLKVTDLAEKFNVSRRTIYRDLGVLESKLKVPLYPDKGRICVQEGYFLPPIHFTLPEALNIFLAVRLLLHYSHLYDPNIANTFLKLNSIVEPPLREQIQKTLEWMEKLPRNEKYLKTLEALAASWVSGTQTRIAYKALGAEEATVRNIDPYFIEPSAPGHSSYVLAYCHKAKELRNFKIERIEKIWPTNQPYSIPSGFDANAYLGSSWGMEVGGEVRTIKLKFAPNITRIMEETIYHPSQSLARQEDGSVIMTLKVSESMELQAWILGWGEKAEVLEPASLRRSIAATTREMLRIYRKK